MFYTAKGKKKARMKFKLSLITVALACVAGAFELYPHGCGNKKIILTGWEFSTLTPEDFLANAEALDKTPADGVVIDVEAVDAEPEREELRELAAVLPIEDVREIVQRYKKSGGLFALRT